MGDLPTERITPDKVFNSTGIDLCGPFFIKNKYQRKGPEIKVYVCIFICLVTKAIHLEIISDLTSQALIAALKRFISRRGKCHKIFSDNGTNMIGANREIKVLSKLVRDREESLFAFFAEGIGWSFIPPRSPNWGGLWEANIKSLKFHFKRVAGNSKFSYEELLTLITQIEAILNSRPLTQLSSHVDDLEVLTPAHFLIGRPITAIVEPSLLQCESNRFNVWQRKTKSVQTIWKRWSLSYLNSLQQRKKWIVNKENLKLGDMVLIREENLPPCKWLLVRVVKIYMGKDKKVRVVDIKTGKGIYKRSINRLSILPIEN
ncbi:integrase catalytic domain-containing protein [Trichonephila clavipes]|nr:integrase catalytic domain-containing protein [Trichonephila clavipes]